jgi:hypothetical protein
MDRTTSIARIITAGFPRSGNSFLGQLLKQSFPNADVPVFSHNVNTLNIVDCIVPIRNPYQSVPSWSAFSGERDLEATARWYMRFNSKVLDNINNLIVIDFVELSTNPLSIVDKVSNHLDLIPKEIDTSVLNKNSKFREYKEYNSPLMEDCFNLYTKIVGQL